MSLGRRKDRRISIFGTVADVAHGGDTLSLLHLSTHGTWTTPARIKRKQKVNERSLSPISPLLLLNRLLLLLLSAQLASPLPRPHHHPSPVVLHVLVRPTEQRVSFLHSPPAIPNRDHAVEQAAIAIQIKEHPNEKHATDKLSVASDQDHPTHDPNGEIWIHPTPDEISGPNALRRVVDKMCVLFPK